MKQVNKFTERISTSTTTFTTTTFYDNRKEIRDSKISSILDELPEDKIQPDVTPYVVKKVNL
jgi:hypothetical protein